MYIQFLFEREGVRPADVAAAADVDLSTAYRWRSGARRCEWPHITRLFARGFLTVDDLRAGGLAIPRMGTDAA